jgi:peptidyl-prolyl cis-trans isomerase-like 4
MCLHRFECEAQNVVIVLQMDNVLIDDRRIHVDFSQSVSKFRWKGKGRLEVLGEGGGHGGEGRRGPANKFPARDPQKQDGRGRGGAADSRERRPGQHDRPRDGSRERKNGSRVDRQREDSAERSRDRKGKETWEHHRAHKTSHQHRDRSRCPFDASPFSPNKFYG